MGRFRDDQLVRYARQMVLPDVGGTGQERLLAARVLVRAGGGAAARAAATYLAAAGVGRLVLDGAPGAGAFGWGEELRGLNPDVHIELRPAGAGATADADPDAFAAVLDFTATADVPAGPAAALHGAFAAAEALKRILQIGRPAAPDALAEA
jgi:hypothetical protein